MGLTCCLFVTIGGQICVTLSLTFRPVDSPPSRIPSDFSDSSDTEDPSVPDVCARPGGESLGTSFSESQSLLRFWYIDHSGKSVLEKDLATVTFNGAESSCMCTCNV